jgi:integral membrane protein
MAQPARSVTSRRGALLRYRVMAYVVGVMLIVVFATIPFDSVEAVVGPIHGVLYIVYLATVLQVVVQFRLKLWTFVGMVACGWLPFLAFIMERYVTRRLQRMAAQVAGEEPGQIANAPETAG